MSNTALSNKQIEDTNFKWYVLSIVSWQESIVLENLKETIKKNNLQNQVDKIFFPEIKTAKINKDWEKKITTKKLHPGYMYVRSMMNDKIWYVLRNTPWVRLVIGSEIYPTPVEEKEMEKILQSVKESNERTKMDIPYKKWDFVKLKSDELWGIEWKIININKETWEIQIQAELMWRTTTVNVWVNKIEKIVK